MMRAERGGQVPAESLSMDDELSDHSSSDEDDPRMVLGSPSSAQRGQQHHDGASTSAQRVLCLRDDLSWSTTFSAPAVGRAR